MSEEMVNEVLRTPEQRARIALRRMAQGSSRVKINAVQATYEKHGTAAAMRMVDMLGLQQTWVDKELVYSLSEVHGKLAIIDCNSYRGKNIEFLCVHE